MCYVVFVYSKKHESSLIHQMFIKSTVPEGTCKRVRGYVCVCEHAFIMNVTGQCCITIINLVILSVFLCTVDTDFYESFLMGLQEAASIACNTKMQATSLL